MRVLEESVWRSAREAHLRKFEPWVSRRRQRRSCGKKHPFEDFLWEYYSLKSGKLLHWSPGADVELRGAGVEEFPDNSGYRSRGGGRGIDLKEWMGKRGKGLEWMLNLLRQTQNREPFFGCLGLHEWAMVYEGKDIRHPQLPLRLGQRGTREVVETLPLCCTHFDAFRFFSETARPLNRNTLTSENRAAQEQPGCLHANMDLFKWCMKLQPLIPSSLTEKCFDLAWEARIIDMRASAYDVSSMGYEPIAVETASGRREYMKRQKEIYRKALPLRQSVIEELEKARRLSGVG